MGGSRARSSVSTQLEATDVHAETASGSLETVAPVRASPLLLLLLRPPTPRQQRAVTAIWVNPSLLLVCLFPGQRTETWPASRSIITFGTRYATLNSYRE